MKNNLKLKRCPFCGGQAGLRHDEFMGHERAFVKCKGCSCVSKIAMEGWTMAFKGNPAQYISTKQIERDTIASWNRRFKKHDNTVGKNMFREVTA